MSSDEDPSIASDSVADVEERASGSPDPRRRREKRKRRDSSVLESRVRPKTLEGRPRDLEASDMAFSKNVGQVGDGYSMSSVASVSTAARSKRRRTPDVVARGFLSEDDAHALYQVFVDYFYISQPYLTLLIATSQVVTAYWCVSGGKIERQY